MFNDLLSSIKEINRLISKAMPNIYYREKLTVSSFRLLASFSGDPTHANIIGF